MTSCYRPFLLASASTLFFIAPVTAQTVADMSPGEAPHADDHHDDEAEEAIIVQGTRNRRRVQDEPIRVEVIAGEEIEEKAIMRPGNIAMLVSETGGVRVQTTSPALGAANVRIQGLEGRYTQLLADGLPLYGGQTASLGLLQIPPTDLSQVEVIKGAASALYGSSALGGVINLISRRPDDRFAAEILANATTRNGQDLTAYLGTPLATGFGASLTAGAHRQSGQDIDGDGWYDMPAYDRLTARPRFQWDGDDGSSVYLTLGVMTEERIGGTLPGRQTPDGSSFEQTQDTDRFDAGLVAETPLGSTATLHLRASAMRQDHLHRYGTTVEDDRHENLFTEASLSGGIGSTSWVAGAAFQSDRFRSKTFSAFDYSYDVPGLFGQLEHEATQDLTLAASARLDFHDQFGTQFSPRLSALYRPGPWTIRGSFGGGFFAPTPFVDEIEAAGLSRLEPLGDLVAEKAHTASLDIGYARGPFEANVTFFGANIENATQLVEIAPDRVRLTNTDGTSRVRGSELLLRFKQNGYTLTGSYVFVDSSEPDPVNPGRRTAPLTPRHTAGLVGMWEEHGKGRIGLEAYYTGKQRLEDNPYRQSSRPYVHLGIMGEIVLGPISLFANAENLLNNRQTRYDPLLLPSRAASGQWTVDAWAPLDGFTLNGGVRLRFGGD